MFHATLPHISIVKKSKERKRVTFHPYVYIPVFLFFLLVPFVRIPACRCMMGIGLDHPPRIPVQCCVASEQP